MSNRERPWSDPREWAGGLIMFVTEALIVIGLAIVALAFSALVLVFF